MMSCSLSKDFFVFFFLHDVTLMTSLWWFFLPLYCFIAPIMFEQGCPSGTKDSYPSGQRLAEETSVLTM
jgi:hypothetical protein